MTASEIPVFSGLFTNLSTKPANFVPREVTIPLKKAGTALVIMLANLRPNVSPNLSIAEFNSPEVLILSVISYFKIFMKT